MVKDATYTVKTKGEGTVVINAKTNKETITKEIEMTAAIDKTEVTDILKCGKVVFVSETGGEYYAVKVFRASQDYTNGKLTEIKEVGTIQNNIDYVQLEPDNYAEEVEKAEKNEKECIGNWSVVKAYHMNQEVSLQEIYGTSIKHGVGKLGLGYGNEFTDQIAPIYESEDTRAGYYEVIGNQITLNYKNGDKRYATYNSETKQIKYTVFDDYYLIMEKD